jgi:DNA-binding HxlR family transcriptional regulator
MNEVQFRTKSPPGGVPTTVDGCPLRTAVGAIGGRWKPLVLHYLLRNPLGFGELSRACEGVSNKTLATQLRELERDGLVSRTVCNDARRSVRYAPTSFARLWSGATGASNRPGWRARHWRVPPIRGTTPKCEWRERVSRWGGAMAVCRLHANPVPCW